MFRNRKKRTERLGLVVREKKNQVLYAAIALSLALVSRPMLGQTTTSTDPLKTIIPVQLNGANGDITIGAKTTTGPNFHMVAISRQPNRAQLDAPVVIWDRNYTDAGSVNSDLTALRTTNPDAMIIVNARGSYRFSIWDVAILGEFGGTGELLSIPETPFAFIGISGLPNGSMLLQRAGSTRSVNGYLAPDSNGNYTFIQTDFLRYDIAANGDITIGGTTYPVSAVTPSYCDGKNLFHLIWADREDPTTIHGNGAYCTGSSDSEIARLSGDLNFLTASGTAENALVFLGTIGSPIPANLSFGANGDPRFSQLASLVRSLGGFWETIAYLRPGDTYSLVGTAPPPAGTKNASNRARESSSVYPEIAQGKRPTGELHGVLARTARGHFYSPLNADPSGSANLGFYETLAVPSAPFPVPSTSSEVTVYQSINTTLCGSSTCNIRDLYDDLDVSLSGYQSQLRSLLDSAGKNCDVSGSGADPVFCKVRGQLLTELTYVGDIRALYNNIQGLWLGSGTTTIFSQLSVYNDIESQLSPPPSATSQSLAAPLTNLFLGLASYIPDIGAIFGIADVAFNFGTGLTTDSAGNKKIDLTSTIANLQQQATDQFTSQQTTTGTFFEMVYQDWGKLSALGSALSSQTNQSSPWYWGSTTTGRLLNQLTPAIRQAAYQNIMAAAYTIGAAFPTSSNSNGWSWGQYPLYLQPYGYEVLVDRSSPDVPISHPFFTPSYIPFTFPNDSTNPYADDSRTSILMTAGTWLGISQKDSPWQGTSDDFQYTPPSESVRTELFDPIWKGGLGVYRPAFFNQWAFPRVLCTQSFGDYNGYSYSGGCDWNASATAVEHLAAPRGPALTSVTIRAHQMLPSAPGPRTTAVQVHLAVHNNGTVDIRSMTLDSITVRTLGPGGATTLSGPTLPVQITDLRPGQAESVYLTLNVPLGVSRISITQQGTMTSGAERQPSTFRFSEAQALFIK